MFCRSCGAPLREGAKFCRNCGAPVPKEPLPENRNTETPEIQYTETPDPTPEIQYTETPDPTPEIQYTEMLDSTPEIQYTETPDPTPEIQYTETPEPTPEHPGARTPEPARESPRKQKKKFRGGQIAACLILLVLTVNCLTGTVWMTRKLADPSRTAQHFLEAVLAGNVDTAYGMLDFQGIEEDVQAILTAEVFAQMLPSQMELEEEPTGQVKELRSSEIRDMESAYPEDADHRHLALTWTSGEKETKWYITLVRQEEKQWFLFPVWKVAAVDLPAAELEIYVPEGAEATLDGQPLPDSWKQDGGEGGAWFRGEAWIGFYDLYVSMEGFEDYRDAVTAGDSVEVSFRQLRMQSQLDLLSRSSGYMEEILTAAAQGTASQTVAEAAENGADYDYSQDLADLQKLFNPGDGSGIQGIRVSGLEGTVTVYQGEEALCALVNLDSQLSFQIVTASMDPVLGGVTYHSEPVESEMPAEFLFHYQDGQWKLMEMSF